MDIFYEANRMLTQAQQEYDNMLPTETDEISKEDMAERLGWEDYKTIKAIGRAKKLRGRELTGYIIRELVGTIADYRFKHEDWE